MGVSRGSSGEGQYYTSKWGDERGFSPPMVARLAFLVVMGGSCPPLVSCFSARPVPSAQWSVITRNENDEVSESFPLRKRLTFLTYLREDGDVMVTSGCLVLARKERRSGRVSADFKIEIEILLPRGHSEEIEMESRKNGVG